MRHFLSRKQFQFERCGASECSQQDNNETYLPVIQRKLQLAPHSITECDKIRQALLCLRPAKHVWWQLTLSTSRKKQIEAENRHSRVTFYRHNMREKLATFILWFRSETTDCSGFPSFNILCVINEFYVGVSCSYCSSSHVKSYKVTIYTHLQWKICTL